MQDILSQSILEVHIEYLECIECLLNLNVKIMLPLVNLICDFIDGKVDIMLIAFLLFLTIKLYEKFCYYLQVTF